jgi:hypothetical protein
MKLYTAELLVDNKSFFESDELPIVNMSVEVRLTDEEWLYGCIPGGGKLLLFIFIHSFIRQYLQVIVFIHLAVWQLIA